MLLTICGIGSHQCGVPKLDSSRLSNREGDRRGRYAGAGNVHALAR